jgi:hypothetical protein
VTGRHPNFALLDSNNPEIASLIGAMLQARDAVERRSWAADPTRSLGSSHMPPGTNPLDMRPMHGFYNAALVLVRC